jgi:hypothetical protein
MAVLQTIHSEQAAFHRWCDEVYPHNRLVSSKENGHALFITLMLVAQKPG